MQRLGDYDVGEVLGEGGFSTVRVGIHCEDKSKAALKILRREALGGTSSSVMKQVEREVNAMSLVQHANVIKLMHVDWNAALKKKDGAEEEVIVVVLELATGGELFDFLSFSGCFEESIARSFFHQLLDGLSACHAKGVAHRDLKPENLLLSGDFTLKLADFGFSCLSDDPEKLMYTECGTPGYMAPEMLLGKGYQPVLCDVWAAGVVLFIMVAGFPPFQKPDKTDWWFNKLLTDRHALFWRAHCRTAKFSDSFKDLINKILQPDPLKRISLSEIRDHEWCQGDVMPAEALRQELERRKRQVDEQKSRERFEHKGVAGAASGELESSVMRGGANSASSDVLPPLPPSMTTFRPPQSSDTAVLDLSTPQLFDNEDGDELKVDDAVATESGAQKLPVFEDSVHTSCYTRFGTTKAPADLVSAFRDVLNRLDARYTVSNGTVVNARVVTECGIVVVDFQLYSCQQQQGVTVCEIRRRKGEFVQFQQLFAHVRRCLESFIDVDSADLPVV